jgi:integrase
LTVFTGFEPVSGKRLDIHETVRAPNTRAGAKQADARLAAIIAAVEEGREVESPSRRRSGMQVAELAERWQQANRPRRNERTGEWIGWSPKTAKTHADNFRLYILPTLGSRDASSVTGLQLDDLYRALEERGLSAAVVVRCHSQVRAMFGWALRKKLVPANPALAADPPKLKPTLVQVPSMAAVRSVQDQAPPMFATYIHLAATIGARRGTMVALRWANVDLESRQITFARAVAESGSGQIEKGTKAERPYVVSLGTASTAALSEHRTRCDEAARAVGVALGPASYVFSDDGGASHWDLGWPTHAWKRYANKAGVTGVRLHDLRHTAASQMLMAGVPLSVVAERLGCTEANILRTYRHFIPGSDRDAAELMDRMFGEAPEPAAG